MYQIIQKRKIWLSLSGILVVASLAVLALWGLNFGIDFKGGSLLEVRFIEDRPAVTEVQTATQDLDLGGLIIQPVGEQDMILRFRDVDEDDHQAILGALNSLLGGSEESPVLEELRFDSVGPSIGAELKSKSISAIIIILIFIILYIALVFRKVSKPVSSWKYGLTAIIALFHDVIIVLGVFAILGKFYGVEINTPFVAAILTVLGYSVNDTIVVLDRVRENLPKSEEDFENTINTSLNQVLTRSINTSLTTLMVLVAILVFGGDSIKDFVLALSIGVFIGTYSSIFLASPLLVVWEKFRK